MHILISSTEILITNQLVQGGKSRSDTDFRLIGLRLGNILTMLPWEMAAQIERSDHMQDRKPAVLAKKKARSRVTNGRSLLPRGVDGRSLWVRRFRDLNVLHLNDLGGEDAVSEAERAIVRRAATIIVALERLEFEFAQAGEAGPNQLELYQRLSNTLRRLLESVGLERRSKDVTSLGEILRGAR